MGKLKINPAIKAKDISFLADPGKKLKYKKSVIQLPVEKQDAAVVVLKIEL